MGVYSAETDLATLTQSESLAIREQLRRLLGSVYFAHSKRFPDLLGYVIERTLAGQAEGIKERTLGVEVFGRDANYDTGSDPIVRVAAGEVRKRLAQYYQEVGHEDELRITLPSGSYVPKFHRPNAANASEQPQQLRSETEQVESISPGVVEESATLASATQLGEPKLETQNSGESSDPFFSHPILPSEKRKPRHFGLILIASGVIALLLFGGTFFVWRATHRSPFSFFWGPVLAGSDPVLICVPEQFHGSGIALHDTIDPDGLHSFSDASKQADFTTVTTDDMDAVVKLTGVLRSYRRRFNILSDEASLADLKLGPAIFVGAFDNVWTLRLTNSLRYHFLNDSTLGPPRIVDRTAPTGPGWVARMTSTGSYRDYAIVARFTDGDTGKPAVVVAGLGRSGTQAAGQFVSDPEALNQVEGSATAAGGKKNIEVVLSTRVIDGQPGSPKIEAVYFW